MSVIYNAKILLKTGYGDPGTVLDLGEAGFDISTNKLYIGTGVGNIPNGVAMEYDLSTNTFKFVQEASLGIESFYFDASGYIQTSGAGSIGAGLVGKWRYDSSTSDSDPGLGFFRLNDVSIAIATYIYISYSTIGNKNLGDILLDFKIGDNVYFQKLPAVTEYAIYKIIGEPIDAITYVKLPVITTGVASTSLTNNTDFGAIFLYTGRDQFALTTYVDGSLNTKVSKSGDTMTGTLHVPNVVDVSYIDFKYGFFDNSIGRLGYDSAEGTLSFGVPRGSLQIGKEIFDYYKNISGVTLVDGDVVSIVGINGGKIAVDLTDPKNEISSQSCVGMVTDGSANNEMVRVTKIGDVHELNTIGLTEGQPVYVDPINPGKLTSSIPQAPYCAVRVGVVGVEHASAGIISVDLRIATRLTDLFDVDGTPLLSSGQFPVWHSDISVFDFDKNINDYSLISDVSTALSAIDASLNTKASYSYVDGSLAARDVSIESKTSYLYVDGSLNTKASYAYVDGSLNTKASYAYVDGSLNTKASYAYVDGSLNTRDASAIYGFGDTDKVAIWRNDKYVFHDDNLVYDASNHRLGIGPVTLDPSNPASLTIDSGLITSINAITAFGDVDSYYQINLQNKNGGSNASSDIVVTASNGDEEQFYMGMGINSPAYSGGFGGGPNDAYLLSNAENMIITNVVPGKDIIFSTEDLDSYLGEKIRIKSDGKLLIAKTSGNYAIDVSGGINSNYYLENDISLSSIYASITYVDASFNYLNNRINNSDSSISVLYNSNFLKESSIGNDFWFNGSVLDISTSFKNQVRNVGSGQYQPWYQKIGTFNEFRSLQASNGLIINVNASTAFLDASINIPGFLTITGVPFSGNLNETAQRLFFTDLQIRAKTSNTVAEIGASGVTQLAPNLDADTSQGLWYPYGTTTWDASGIGSVITWNDWIIFYDNEQKVKRSSFTLDVSNYENGVYAVFFNNATGTPFVETSLTLDRRSYAAKAYIGHFAVQDGSILKYHESPDMYGTPYITRDRNSFGITQIQGFVASTNPDGYTLSMSAGSWLLEGANFRNMDYYTGIFTGSQHIETRTPAAQLTFIEIEPSTGFFDASKGFFTNILSYKADYYEASTNSIQTWDGSTKFLLSGLYSLEQGSAIIRKAGLYDTLNDAISDIFNFEATASPISSVATQIHPQIGFIINATDCSTTLDPTRFSLQNIIRAGSSTSSGGGSIGGILGAQNIGSGQGIYFSTISNLLQLKGISAGSSNSIKVTATADTILIDASVKNYDGSINNLYNVKTDKTYSNIQDISILTHESSINQLFSNQTLLTSKIYVDGSLAARDVSIETKTSKIYVDGSLNVKTSFTYVDGSLSARDASIEWLFANKVNTSTLALYTTRLYVDGSLAARDSSLNVLFTTKPNFSYVDASLVARDVSLGNLSHWEVLQDSSIVTKVAKTGDVMTGSLLINASLNVVGRSSLLTTDISGNLTFVGGLRTITTDLSSNLNGTNLTIHPSDSSNNGVTASRGGNLILSAGDALSTAASSGHILIKAGDGITSNPGVVTIKSGLVSATSGDVSIFTPDSGGASGSIFIKTGNSSGSTGNINITAGAANANGNIILTTPKVGSVIFRQSNISIEPSTNTNVSVNDLWNDSSSGNSRLIWNDGSTNMLVSNPYGQNFQYAQDFTDTGITSTSPTYTTRVSITTPTIPVGTYRISANYQMKKAVTNSDIMNRVQVDGANLGEIQNHELSDATTWIQGARILFITFATATTHTITLQFTQEAPGTMNVRDAVLEIIRVQ